MSFVTTTVAKSWVYETRDFSGRFDEGVQGVVDCSEIGIMYLFFVEMHKNEDWKESLTKGEILVKGLVGKVKSGYLEGEEPKEVGWLETVLEEPVELICSLK